MKASERLRQLYIREYPNLEAGKTRYYQLQDDPMVGVGVTATGKFPFIIVLPLGSIDDVFKSDQVQAVPHAERDLESVLDGSRSEITASVLYFRDFTRAAEIVLDSIVEALQAQTRSTSVPDLVNQFIDLFTSQKTLSAEEITGFFGELTTIAVARNPDALVTSWHVKREERFDFNTASSRLEIKTTTQARRIHNLSSTQVPAPPGVSVQIVSILTQVVPDGATVFDLFEMARARVQPPTQRRLDEIFSKFVCQDEGKCQELLFDFDMASSSLELFDSEEIPQPVLGPGILSAHWEADFTNVNPAHELNDLAKDLRN